MFAQGAEIDSWGVGTNMITSKDTPAFGGVYKLSAVAVGEVSSDSSENWEPKIKLSENTVKVTNPGNKTVFRIYDKESGKIKADLIALAGETFDTNQDMT